MNRRAFTTSLATAAVLTKTLTLPAHAATEGLLRVAIPTSLNTLDPAKTKVADEYNVTFLIFSGLTQIDLTGRIQPDLAESWFTDDDLTTWTFRLRTSVKFHNGRVLDAADVKASIERIIDPATGSVARGNFSVVQSIDVVDPLTVRFRLNTPYADFAGVLADRQVKIVPRDAVETIASTAIGTGPFKLKEFRPGDRVDLVRNPDYYVAGQPKLAAVQFRIMPETAARVAALTTGEIDLVWDVPPETLGQLKRNSDIVIDSVPTSSWDGIALNNLQKPFNDARVRKAVLLAVDKRMLVDVAMFGNATPTLTMISPANVYFDKDLPILSANPVAARKLLAEAEYPNGFAITCYVPTGRPPRERIGVMLREMLKPAGINVDIQQMPQDKFAKEVEGKAALYVVGYYSRATIDLSIYPFLHSKGTWNSVLWHYNNPEMDVALDQLRKTKEETDRKRLYDKVQQVVIDDPPGVIPYVINHANAYRRSVQGFRTSPMMWLDLRDTTVA